MWRASEHSDSENSRWILLRSIEWVQWPLFISQPIVPILLWFCEWQPVVLAVIAVSIIWRFGIATRFVSIRLADLGPILVVLKFVVCPVMAFLIWKQGDQFGAVLALLWPMAVLLIQQLLNAVMRIASIFAHRNILQAEFDTIQDRFIPRLLGKLSSPRPGKKSAMNSNTKLELLTWIEIGVLCVPSWLLAERGVIPIWGAIVITFGALLAGGLIACFTAWSFMGTERYLEFIKRAKAEQNEVLERQRKRREERKQK